MVERSIGAKEEIIMSWSDDAVADSGLKTPVRNAVREVLPHIAQARIDGASWGAIFRKLKKEGKSVGAAPSSFNNARRALKDELDTLIAELTLARSSNAIPAPPVVAAVPAANQLPARSKNHVNLADDRKPLAFGDH